MSDKDAKLSKVNSTDDTKAGAPLANISSLGGTNMAVIVQPYGLTSMPPNGVYAVELPINGETANKVIIPIDLAGRTKNLKQGEVVLENTVTGCFIIQDFNGDISIVAPTQNINIMAANQVRVTAAEVIANATTVTVNATTVNIVADVNITGGFTVNGKNVSDTHTHSGVTPGVGNTGGVN